jgi:hypothetical protein
MKQLRLTIIEPISMFTMDDFEPLIMPDETGELIYGGNRTGKVYIDGEAQSIAGFDIPYFIDGNLGQLELPIEQQDILLLLPCGEYKCKAEYNDSPFASDCYLITLKD